MVRRPAPPSALLLVPGADRGDGVARWWGPDDDGQRTKSVATPNPPAYAAEQLLAALRRADIEVIGTARHADTFDPPAPVGAPLHTVQGPTVHALVTETNHASVNLYAEVLLMQLGRIAGEDATTYGGLDALRGYLEEIGYDPKRVRLADGSGLSRMGLLSASCLTTVLADAVRRDPSFADTLSAAQGRGTMRGRLPEHPKAHRVRAKTGSLTGHRNLAGLIDNRYAFAFLVSGAVMSRSAVDGAVDDALTVALDRL